MAATVPESKTTLQESVPKAEKHIVDLQTLPDEETTLYRDSQTVIRILPNPTPGCTATVTLYTHITDKTQDFTTKHKANNSITPSDTATTDADLPDTLRDTFRTVIDTVERNLGVTRQTETGEYGVCHRKYEHVGKHGIVTIRTTLH